MTQEGDVCSICLEQLDNGKALFTTGCKHSFHFSCIRQSVEYENDTCPLCRKSFADQTPPTSPRTPALPSPLVARGSLRRTQSFGARYSNAGLVAPQTQVVGEIPLDEPLEAQHTHGESIAGLTLSFAHEFATVSTSACELLSLLTLRAGCLAEADARIPSDIVAVVDVSGSMQGAKLQLLKITLNFLASQLSASDRFSVVTFNSSAAVLSPLRCMTAANKQRLHGEITCLRTQGGTEIAAGLSLGVRVLQQRRHRNAVASIVLLTDGQDNHAAQMIPSLCNGLEFAINTIGFGSDHDATVCAMIAECARGSFNYVEQENTVADAFANVLGGVLTTVAQSIRVTVDMASGFLVQQVQPTVSNGSAPCSSLELSLGDLFAEEQRDILLRISAPEAGADGEMHVLSARLSYVPSGTVSETTLPPQNASILRMASAVQQASNPTVDLQRNRICAAAAMAQATQSAAVGELDAARSVIDECVSRIRGSITADHTLCVALLQDLAMCCERFRTMHSYQSGGDAFVRSTQRTHSLQRGMSTRELNARSGLGYSNRLASRMTAAGSEFLSAALACEPQPSSADS
eukprot:TRINITY_DN12662_c0_g2_i2.p1 TRINITY_DN12662_c0_g2~~TRINITY_DN12662_c0_g2_i2.p1  ORF type:complete len:577 (+),score=87.25 TRINITY_DN12662_c0_g2_i2:144-1874(+)